MVDVGETNESGDLFGSHLSNKSTSPNKFVFQSNKDLYKEKKNAQEKHQHKDFFENSTVVSIDIQFSTLGNDDLEDYDKCNPSTQTTSSSSHVTEGKVLNLKANKTMKIQSRRIPSSEWKIGMKIGAATFALPRVSFKPVVAGQRNDAAGSSSGGLSGRGPAMAIRQKSTVEINGSTVIGATVENVNGTTVESVTRKTLVPHCPFPPGAQGNPRMDPPPTMSRRLRCRARRNRRYEETPPTSQICSVGVGVRPKMRRPRLTRPKMTKLRLTRPKDDKANDDKAGAVPKVPTPQFSCSTKPKETIGCFGLAAETRS